MVAKNKSAQALAKLRAKSLTPEERKAIAQKAAKTRWSQPRRAKGRGGRS